MKINKVLEIDKFHTFTLTSYKILNLDVKEAKYASILSFYLDLVNNKYQTLKEMHDFLAKNFDLSYRVMLNRYGKLYILKYEMRGIDPSFINEKNYNYKYLIKKFNEITKPLVIDNKFSKAYINRVKKIYQSNTLNEFQDNDFKASYYSLNKLFKDKSFNYISLLTKKELKEINETNLYELYKKISKIKSYTILVGRNVSNIKTYPIKTNLYLHAYKYPLFNSGTVIKKYDSSQSYLRIYYDIPIYSGTKDIAPMSIYSHILGEGAYSKLFSVVREKYGLCYNIDCDTDFSCGIFYISSTIKKCDLNKTLQAIDEAIDNSLTDINLDEIKDYFIKTIEQGYDYIKNYSTTAFYNDNFKDVIQDDTYINYIRNVSIDDLYKCKNYLKKKKLIYLYGGDLDE